MALGTAANTELGSDMLEVHLFASTLDFLLRREHAEGPRRLFGNYPIHHNRHMY